MGQATRMSWDSKAMLTNLLYLTAKCISLISGDFIVDVACGSGHSLFLDINGNAYGCGSNTIAQLGLSSKEERCKPIFILPKIEKVYAVKKYSLFQTKKGKVWINIKGALNKLCINKCNRFEYICPSIKYFLLTTMSQEYIYYSPSSNIIKQLVCNEKLIDLKGNSSSIYGITCKQSLYAYKSSKSLEEDFKGTQAIKLLPYNKIGRVAQLYCSQRHKCIIKAVNFLTKEMLPLPTSLENMCILSLLESIGLENACELFSIADTINSDSLKVNCAKFISMNLVRVIIRSAILKQPSSHVYPASAMN
jgi:Regulator of chromosome condensation (RCC1) repeat